jgi:hypothetical protein
MSSYGDGGELARDVSAQREAERQLADSAQIELRVAERTRELEAAHAEALQRLALAAEYRDDDTWRSGAPRRGQARHP